MAIFKIKKNLSHNYDYLIKSIWIQLENFWRLWLWPISDAMHEFFLNKISVFLNDLTNSHVIAKNINSFKADLNSLPTLAAKAYQAQ